MARRSLSPSAVAKVFLLALGLAIVLETSVSAQTAPPASRVLDDQFGRAANAAEARPPGALPGELDRASHTAEHETPDYWSSIFVFVLATFIGLGVIARVSRLLHTPLMSLTNAISAIAVVGAILVTGPDYPVGIRFLGLVALFASMTNAVSGFLITDRMLKMFKQPPRAGVER